MARWRIFSFLIAAALSGCGLVLDLDPPNDRGSALTEDESGTDSEGVSNPGSGGAPGAGEPPMNGAPGRDEDDAPDTTPDNGDDEPGSQARPAPEDMPTDADGGKPTSPDAGTDAGDQPNLPDDAGQGGPLDGGAADDDGGDDDNVDWCTPRRPCVCEELWCPPCRTEDGSKPSDGCRFQCEDDCTAVCPGPGFCAVQCPDDSECSLECVEGDPISNHECDGACTLTCPAN